MDRKNIFFQLGIHFLMQVLYFFIVFLFSIYLPFGIVDTFTTFYGVMCAISILIFALFFLYLILKINIKKVSIVVYLLFYLIFFISSISFSVSMKNFSKEKWEKYPLTRHLMFDSYMKKNTPLGRDLAYLEETLGPVDTIGVVRYNLPEEVLSSEHSASDSVERKAYIYRNIRKDFKTRIVVAFIIDDYANISEVHLFDEKTVEIY
ncbi:MAG: hypothetical protein JXR63_06380 [Spirochaetales bacterium]|nr:hypothetical protein [Spirochaetales bacterium]